MSERLMERFREDAERSVRVPAIELIEQSGRTRRRRRRTVAGVTAAVVAVGIVGATELLGIGDTEQPQPASDPSPSSLVTPYPGDTMRTLEAGTYELDPSLDGSGPQVHFTVPEGWNAWRWPNRFEGLGPDVTDNERVLEQGVDWYLGMTVLEVDQMLTGDCISTDVSRDTPESMAGALQRIRGLIVTSGPESTIRFGHPAVHLRLRAGSELGCPWLFRGRFGNPAGGAEAGGTYDAWVIDAGDRPLLVWSEWSRRAPRAEVAALLGIVDTIEVVAPE